MDCLRDLLVMNKEYPVEVPMEILSPEAISGVIQDFILREGTDYGIQEITHEKKIDQIQRQMLSGEIKIVFDPNTESITLMGKRDWLLLTSQRSLEDEFGV